MRTASYESARSMKVIVTGGLSGGIGAWSGEGIKAVTAVRTAVGAYSIWFTGMRQIRNISGVSLTGALGFIQGVIGPDANEVRIWTYNSAGALTDTNYYFSVEGIGP